MSYLQRPLTEGLAVDDIDQLVRQINAVRPAAEQERAAVFATCPENLFAVAQALILHDDGILTADQVVATVRRALSVGKPVMPSSMELGRLTSMLYAGLRRGAVPDTAVGG